jgi:cytochrome c
MESPSFDGSKSAVRSDSSDERWNVKRLAAYLIFGVALLAAPGIAAQDSAAGKASFGKCQTCHAVGAGAKNKLGPELNALVGRKAGTAAGYQYSPALKNAGFAWDQTSFAAFIANPRGKIPGNKMVFAGIKNETEIANLWTYLSHINVDGSSK